VAEPSVVRTVLVTGASRGIGKAVAERAAAAGARVALLARNAAALHRLADELGNDAVALPCDLTDAKELDGAMRHAQEAFGGAPDVLINNAGDFWLAPVSGIDGDAFARLYALNVTAPILVTQAVLPGMRARGSGTIVQVGSVADRDVRPGNAAYAGTKHALRVFHETLREELRGSGVRASLVSPAATDTALWDTLLASDAAASLPTRAQMLTDDDVADAIWYVATRPAHVTIDELRLSRS
jgi:NADP-dependent 3-hydroxy acid dehydrogenase YdfG